METNRVYIDTRLQNSPLKVNGFKVTPVEVRRPLFNGFPMRAVTEDDIKVRESK